MGTKRRFAPVVRERIIEAKRPGRVVDLFSGMGSVAAALAPDASVVTNDILHFTTAFARARFLDVGRCPSLRMVEALIAPYESRRRQLLSIHGDRLQNETQALETDASSLLHYMDTASHAGSSERWELRARAAAGRHDAGHYSLATLYFSAGYFSTFQAIEIDSIRYAIEKVVEPHLRDWVISAWLAAAAAVINAPGHTAQYLRPNSVGAFHRIRRQWQRSVWGVFVERLGSLPLVGTRKWRRDNVVYRGDALELLKRRDLGQVGLVYADPPYTKDQYSRYYHVYETLYLYDYPASIGVGRYREGRFSTPFSMKSTVQEAFDELIGGVASIGVPFVLSYPSNGLLSKAGCDIRALLRAYFGSCAEGTVEHVHSTLGASNGEDRRSVTEHLFVCTP